MTPKDRSRFERSEDEHTLEPEKTFWGEESSLIHDCPEPRLGLASIRYLVRLRPDSRFLLPPALFTSSIVLATLIAFAIARPDGLENSSLASLLLIAPGALSIYVVRLQEHGLATLLFKGIRYMAATSGACGVLGGLILYLNAAGSSCVAGSSDPWSGVTVIIWTLVVIATLAQIGLLTSYLSSKETVRKRVAESERSLLQGFHRLIS